MESAAGVEVRDTDRECMALAAKDAETTTSADPDFYKTDILLSEGSNPLRYPGPATRQKPSLL